MNSSCDFVRLPQVQAVNDRISEWCEALKLGMPAGEVDNVERLSVGDAAQVRGVCVYLCALFGGVKSDQFASHQKCLAAKASSIPTSLPNTQTRSLLVPTCHTSVHCLPICAPGLALLLLLAHPNLAATVSP